jgi:hypothetical protein
MQMAFFENTERKVIHFDSPIQLVTVTDQWYQKTCYVLAIIAMRIAYYGTTWQIYIFAFQVNPERFSRANNVSLR